MCEEMSFATALEAGNLALIRRFPKADLHNHFVLGGCRDYIHAHTGRMIPPVTQPLHSLKEMEAWSRAHVHSRDPAQRRLLLEATFHQAKTDGVTVLEIGEDVWGLSEFYDGDVDALVRAFHDARNAIAPDIELRLQIGLSRHCAIDYLLRQLEPFWGHEAFYSIDLYGDELAQPIERFIPIFRKAKQCGLRLKAHVGEFGTAADVRRAVEALELDEVQHGIAAAKDARVTRFLADHRIRLNITPSSNVLLGRVPSMAEHPIACLHRSGVIVTVNSDDVLIFDSDVSKEYLRLYTSGCLTAQELDEIRLQGLHAASPSPRPG